MHKWRVFNSHVTKQHYKQSGTQHAEKLPNIFCTKNYNYLLKYFTNATVIGMTSQNYFFFPSLHKLEFFGGQ